MDWCALLFTVELRTKNKVCFRPRCSYWMGTVPTPEPGIAASAVFLVFGAKIFGRFLLLNQVTHLILKLTFVCPQSKFCGAEWMSWSELQGESWTSLRRELWTWVNWNTWCWTKWTVCWTWDLLTLLTKSCSMLILQVNCDTDWFTDLEKMCCWIHFPGIHRSSLHVVCFRPGEETPDFAFFRHLARLGWRNREEVHAGRCEQNRLGRERSCENIDHCSGEFGNDDVTVGLGWARFKSYVWTELTQREERAWCWCN